MTGPSTLPSMTIRPDAPVRTPLVRLIDFLREELAGEPMEWVTVIGDPDPVIVTGACLDSRRVRPGDLYFALAGAASHGARFAGQAIEAGAVAILTDVAGSELLAESAAALSQAEFPGIPVVVVASPERSSARFPPGSTPTPQPSSR